MPGLISGAARLAGVIGWPVAHSRSPRLHGHWLARYGIDGAYVPMAVAPDRLDAALRGLAAAGFRGVNVTLPHKEAAMALCRTVDPAARRMGAVNTLVFRDGAIEGSNTDADGFLRSLEAGVGPLSTALAPGPALVLGAGGGARAVAVALADRGIPVIVCNRTRDRAAALAADLPEVQVLPWEERARAVASASLLVNTTQLGMVGQPPLDMPLDAAGPGLVVADIVYTPLETALLAAARRRGLRAVTGIGMLLHQAAPGFEAWFGVAPAVDEALQEAVLA